MSISKTLPIRCPCETKAELRQVEKGFVCLSQDCPHAKEENCFPVIDDLPVLISDIRCDTVFDVMKIVSYYIPRKKPVGKFRKHLKNFLVGENKIFRNNCEAFIRRIKDLSSNPRVLIIGSGTRGVGTDALWRDKDIQIHGIDIYPSPTVDLICDAHYLPLQNDHYDGVWIQAVLEHVVEPDKVVAEIHRVLRDNGIVYAETPFMQQVHAGAYDFTRFTVLGNRYLFRRFRLIEMGGGRGTETVLAWSILYFIWALTRSRTLARFAGIAARVLLRPFARCTSKASLYDSASENYFMGSKSDSLEVTHKSLLALYKGHYKHH